MVMLADVLRQFLHRNFKSISFHCLCFPVSICESVFNILFHEVLFFDKIAILCSFTAHSAFVLMCEIRDSIMINFWVFFKCIELIKHSGNKI